MRRSIGRCRQSTLKPVAKIRKSSSIGPAEVRTCKRAAAPPRPPRSRRRGGSARCAMARDALRAVARRRHLLRVDVVADPPFPVVGQARVALHEAGVAGALALVDARQVGAPHQQVHVRGAGFERGRGAVHRRGAGADHADAQAGAARRSRCRRTNAPSACAAAPRRRRAASGPPRPARPVATHDPAREHAGRAPIGLDLERDQAVGARADVGDAMAVAAPAAPAPRGTSAGSPSTAGAGSCRARPRRRGRTAPRTRRERSAKGCRAPGRRAASGCAGSPCAPSSPTGPRARPAPRRRRRPRRRAAAAPRRRPARSCRRR